MTAKTHLVLDTYYIKKNYANVIKFMKITSNLTHNRQKTQKSTEIQKKKKCSKRIGRKCRLFKT